MEEKVYDLFKKLEIPFKVKVHPALFKAKDNDELNIDFENGICCKNLLLKDKKKDKLYLVCLDISKRANLKNIADKLKTGRLSFASEDELIENLGVKSGSASLLNIVEKQDTKVKFVIDEELNKDIDVWFHPNINTASICFKADKIQKILEYFNADYIYLDF